MTVGLQGQVKSKNIRNCVGSEDKVDGGIREDSGHSWDRNDSEDRKDSED